MGWQEYRQARKWLTPIGGAFLLIIGVVGLIRLFVNPLPENLFDVAIDGILHLGFFIFGLWYFIALYRNIKFHR